MAGTSPAMTEERVAANTCGHDSGEDGARRALRGLLLLRSLVVARIVGWIDVGDDERASAVNLDHGRRRGPCVVLHVLLGAEVAADPQGLAFFHVELVAHAHVECARKHRDVLGCRMRMRRHLVARRQFRADNIRTVGARIAAENRDLRACRQSGGGRSPFQRTGLNENVIVRQCATSAAQIWAARQTTAPQWWLFSSSCSSFRVGKP